MADHAAVPSSGLLGQQLAMPSRVDEITDRLITAIAIGEYLPGARLPVERELAASLGVGRMTVRAALARLVDRGLLETRRGRGGGSYVVDQWPESSTEAVGRTLTMRLGELRDRCDAICRLHGAVCRAAAEARTDTDVARHAGRAGGLPDRDQRPGRPAGRQPAAPGDHGRRPQCGAQAGAASTWRRRSASARPPTSGASRRPMREMELRALHEHVELIDAIADGRADDADALARAHVAIDFEHITAAMRRAGVLAD